MPFNANFSIQGKLPQSHSVSWNGLDLIIQWPKGSVREGKDKDGKLWRREMKCDYGYIEDTSAKGDKEGLDCYIGPSRDSEQVFVLEQLKQDGSFDEYKILLGFSSLEEAQEMYLSHYPKEWGRDRLGDCYEASLDSLRQKVEEHQESKEGGKSASLDKVGKHWDSLGRPDLRLGWLRTQAHICKDWEAFALPWAQLTDARKAKTAARAARCPSQGITIGWQTASASPAGARQGPSRR